MSKIYNNVLELIGNTPIVKLNRTIPDSPHQFFGKVEFLNPGGSVKDRIAVAIVEEAEKRGDIKPGGTIIEATSGNTGVGLALVANLKGYKCIFVMPEKMSGEKVNLLRAFGAKVIITPTGVEAEDPRSHYSVAKKLVEITPNSFLANQYNTPDNYKKHYATTGPEIWEQMGGQIDVLVAGAGTGGTISGCARYLKEKNPNIKVILADPIGSILYDLYYHKKVVTPPAPYKVEGIGEDMLPDNVHFDVMDAVVQVADRDSFLTNRDLLLKDGLFVGPSAGTAVWAAIKYAKSLPATKPLRILVILPDSGDRYLSKAFNDTWMKENGFIESPMKQKTVADLIDKMPAQQKVVSVESSYSVLQVIEALKKHGISQVPVFADHKLIGVVDESDLLLPLASGAIKSNDAILTFIKGTILMVELTESLQKLTELFQQGYVALVKNRQGHLHIITKIDLIEYLGSHLHS